MLNSLNFLNPGQPWPPPSEKRRLQLYSDNKKLFEGEHDKVFKNYSKLLREDQQLIIEIILNFNKRLSTLWSDLLLGEPPLFTAADKKGQDTVKSFTNQNFNNKSYEVAIDVSRYGDGLFKVRHDGQKTIIEGQPPSVWFPVTAPDDVKNIQAHVLAWQYSQIEAGVLGGKKEQWYLKAEIHEKGKITSRLYQSNNPENGNGKIGNLISEEIVMTNIDDFLIVQVSNLLTTDRSTGIDDYSDLDSIIQALEGRVAQIDKILDQHASPNMYGPDAALDVDPITGQTSFKAGGKYFPVSAGDEKPGYVTWEGQLGAAFKEIEILLELLYLLSETSPACFGQLKSGLAESGSALKRLLMVPLAKVNRIRMRFDPALKKVISIASALDSSRGGKSIYLPEDDIQIYWQDGLPADDKEQADIMNTRTGGKATISQKTAIKKLEGMNDKEAEDEIDRINEEETANNPITFPDFTTLTPKEKPSNIQQKEEEIDKQQVKENVTA